MAKSHTDVRIATCAQAAAVLRQRRKAAVSSELFDLWRAWIRTMFPDHVGDLPDEMFRTTGSVEHGGGIGQDPAEVRKQFMEIVEALEDDEREGVDLVLGPQSPERGW